MDARDGTLEPMNARNALFTAGLVAALAGCGQPPQTAYLPAPGSAFPAQRLAHPSGARAQHIYFAGNDNSAHPWGAPEIGVFAATATGNTAAIDVIKGSNTQLASPEIAIPDHNGRIWTCSFGYNNVEAFAPGASGNATPAVEIVGSKVPLNACGGMTLASNGTIYALSFGSVPGGSPPAILLWPAGSNGNASPQSSYSGSKTGLTEPSGVALDAAGRVYVSSGSSIEVFGSSKGNVAPLYKISGSATGLWSPEEIAIDPSTQHLLVADEYFKKISVFAAGAHGNVAPIETITGSATGLDSPYGVAIDPAGYIYVGNCPQSAPHIGSIEVFAPGAKGNASPVQRIVGKTANLTCVSGLTVL